MNRQRRRRPLGTRRACLSLAVVFAVGVTATASARTTAVPQNTSPPTISGNEHEGDTLTAGNGAWDNTPTKFVYQWQRCGSSGSGCADISGAAEKTYTLTSSDVDHTVRVTVTASNSDGQSSATSKTSDVVSSKNGPVNTARPTVSGTAQVGEELSANAGTWTGGVRSYGYQWQRCEVGSSGCADVTGATGNTYGVRSADVGKSLRVVVTATNASGSNSSSSDLTAGVRAMPGSNTIVKVPGNKAPTIAFLSLKRTGPQVFARFRVCDDSRKAVMVAERDAKARVLGFSRRFSVVPTCTTTMRHWLPAPRFRTPGRLIVTLRAVDKSGAASRLVSRGVMFPRAF